MSKKSLKSELLPPPFLKWAGGKKLLLPSILPHIPTDFDTYHEPFLGGAALFFALQPRSARLSDINSKLISTYLSVRDDVEKIIEELNKIEISKERYYEVRASEPEDDIRKAAKFIYLNKTCWNGLYRENKKGEFNVPFGLRDKQSASVVTEPEKLRRSSRCLKNAIISCSDFKEAIGHAKENDFLYLDPPYTVSHNNNGFIEYNASIFSWEDQKNLALAALELSAKGCKVLISNADHESIYELYQGFKFISIERSSTIASNKARRKRVTELLIKNF